MHFAECFNIDMLDTEADYAVFDDIEWAYFPQRKGWLGAQEHFTLTDKYRGKRDWHWGKPCIWLVNKQLSMHEKMTVDDLNWVRGNCVIVHLTRPLY